MTANSVIEADNVSVRAGRATLLKNASVQIRAGEVVAIVGPNGAGKSTLLRTMSGDLRPSSGVIRLKQRNIASYAPTQLAGHRAMLSQHVNVGFAFTVEEIVLMGAGDRPRHDVEQLIDDTIDELALGLLRRREVPSLSGGEQQRTHFARVLVQLACGEIQHGPGVLLLDEPTASLDLRHQLTLAETARRRAQGGTAVVAVVHDLNLAVRFADRIVVLHGGEVVGDGSPATIVTDAMIRDVFDVEITVGNEPGGLPFVLPQRAAPPSTDTVR